MLSKAKLLYKRLIGYDNVQRAAWKRRDRFTGTPYEHEFTFDKDKKFVGIIVDVAHEHQYYIQACVDLNINYKVIDINGRDWIEKIKDSGCAVFLIWPTIYKPIQKQFWDERLYTMVNYLKVKIFPSYDLLWLYESKRKTADWLKSNNLPHPGTYVFFERNEAIQFIGNSVFPLVCKTDQGAASSGVFIVRSKARALSLIRKAFRNGILLKNRGMFDRHQGYIIFQEYLTDCKEWRIIRVGDSYFCRYKIKVGDFHSGSGDIVWAQPPEILLNRTREISEKFEVPNINVDYFETTDGSFLINEIHSLWGGRVLTGEDLEGRYLYDASSGKWTFEKGDFFKNRCANLRLEWIRENYIN